MLWRSRRYRPIRLCTGYQLLGLSSHGLHVWDFLNGSLNPQKLMGTRWNDKMCWFCNSCSLLGPNHSIGLRFFCKCLIISRVCPPVDRLVRPNRISLNWYPCCQSASAALSRDNWFFRPSIDPTLRIFNSWSWVNGGGYLVWARLTPRGIARSTGRFFTPSQSQ